MSLAAPVYTPYKDESLNLIYAILFCDNLSLYKNQSTEYPWNVLLAEEPATDQLQLLAADTALETRPRILAYNLLRSKGIDIPVKELLGVVIEVGIAGGLDTLAAFSDGSARYINYSGKLLVWETRTAESDQLIAQLFTSSRAVVHKIGPWHESRRPFPAEGMIRLNFLVSDGLYFGEGPMEVLQNDAMGGPVIGAAVQLMTYLTQQPG